MLLLLTVLSREMLGVRQIIAALKESSQTGLIKVKRKESKGMRSREMESHERSSECNQCRKDPTRNQMTAASAENLLVSSWKARTVIEHIHSQAKILFFESATHIPVGWSKR